MRISRQIEQHPMYPRAGGRIGIIHNQREALRCRGRIGSVQLGRNIFGVTGVFLGDVSSFRERMAIQFEFHRRLSSP